uniref:Uncharacterized protein n=1 Tax=Panagrolaimus sp. ES5 TaxID=591445 RepID=A0AC34F3H8_9BILA
MDLDLVYIVHMMEDIEHMGHEEFEKVLTVKTEEISFRNLQILCNSPNLTNVTINAKIRGDDNQLVSFEDILALLPNIQRFNLCHCYCTPETPDKLLALKFGKKIQRLRFKYIKSDIDPKKFFLFLVKNLANNAIVAIKFDSMIPYDRRQQLTGILTAIMRGWNAKYPLKIFISFFR